MSIVRFSSVATVVAVALSIFLLARQKRHIQA
jgi:hypothetical protein